MMLSVMLSTSSSDVWPPDTSSAMQRSGSGPCSSKSTATCPTRWLTPYKGLFNAYASALALARPTTRAPISPGPTVTATPSIWDRSMSAVAQARSSVGTMASTSYANNSCPMTMLTPVSSQDDSMPTIRGPQVALAELLTLPLS